MSKPAKKAKTAKKDVALLEDTLREAPFVPDEGPGDSLLALPGGTRSRGVSPGAFAAIKAALEQCAEEVGADFGPEERQWINRIRDGALRRLEPDVAAARREAKRRLLAELAQEAAEERAKLADRRGRAAAAPRPRGGGAAAFFGDDGDELLGGGGGGDEDPAVAAGRAEREQVRVERKRDRERQLSLIHI